MTSFLIAYPDIPANALTWYATYSGTTTYNPDDAYPMESIFYGERHNQTYMPALGTSSEYIWDLGLNNARTIDHLIICNTKYLTDSSISSVKIQGSSDGSSWTDQLGCTTGFTSKTFSGPNSHDIVFTAAFNDSIATTLSSYRYWRLRIAPPAGMAAIAFSKAYSGNFFDMGQEPDFYEWEVISDDVDTWRYPRGHVLMTKSTHAKHRVTIEWDGVTDEKAAEFATTILKNPYRNTVVLYTATYHDVLNGYRSLHCKVLSDECSITQVKQDWNDIRMVVEELV